MNLCHICKRPFPAPILPIRQGALKTGTCLQYVVARTNSLLATHFDGMKLDCDNWQAISDPSRVDTMYPPIDKMSYSIAHDTDVPLTMAWAAGAAATLQYRLCGNSPGCASMIATNKTPPWFGASA